MRHDASWACVTLKEKAESASNLTRSFRFAEKRAVHAPPQSLPLRAACGMIAATKIEAAKAMRRRDREAVDETGCWLRIRSNAGVGRNRG
jgi:hypothetical protein